MTLSREARIILAILVIALAAFIWINYYNRSGGFGGTFSAPESSTAQAPLMPAATPSESQVAASATSGSETAGSEGTISPVAPAIAPGSRPASTPTVARDIQIAQLPFLVTAPVPQETVSSPAQEEMADSALPQTERRVSVNPFSPIIVEAPASPTPAPQPRTEIQVVDIPTAPPVATANVRPNPTPVRAPAPLPAVPQGSSLANLPRALPGGTLPVATEILRSARTGVANPEVDLAEVAAVSVPETVSELELAEATTETAAENGESGSPVPLDPQPVVSNSSAPLVVGASPLSRYLRDNNVVFTGSVLGPVGVGVFRSSLSPSPVVVALGQTLPDTSIVLTSLKGQQAVLTQDSQSQTLILDLRR